MCVVRIGLRNAFWGPKNKFLKRGITNLANGLTFDDVEATADFENQLGPPPAGVITQPQGDAPTAGYIPPPPPDHST